MRLSTAPSVPASANPVLTAYCFMQVLGVQQRLWLLLTRLRPE